VILDWKNDPLESTPPVRGNVKGYSESRLIVILAALGNNVSIVVEPTKGHGRISVRERAAA
jgi:hypothetical protein